MENENEFVTDKLARQIINDGFGLKETPKKMVIEYEDLVKYTKTVMTTLLKSSRDKTDRLLEEQRKNLTTINYN